MALHGKTWQQNITMVTRNDFRQITPELVTLMTDTELKEYIPAHGDRLRLRKYLKEGTSSSNKKNKLIAILQNKLTKKRETGKQETSDEDNTAGTSMPRQVKLYGNKNARKETRSIELGWIHRTHKRTKQVRSRTGGGTRKIQLNKNATRKEILEEALKLFFKNGESSKGKLSNFETDIWDFSEKRLDSGKTIQEVIDETKMATTNIRFYLATWEKDPSSTPSDDILSTAMFTSELPITHINPTLDSQESTQLGIDDKDRDAPAPLEPIQDDSDLPDPNFPDLEPTFGDDNGIDHLEPTFITGKGFDHNSDSVMADLDSLLPSLELPTRPRGDLEVSSKIMQPNVIEVKVRVHRGHVLMNMISAFKSIDVKNAIISFEMVMPNGNIELAEDGGGVTRDTLAEFWGEFYENCTLGTTEKVPFLRHDFGDAEWQSVAKIILFGWRKERYFPVAISKQLMMQCLFANVDQDGLLESFFKYLPESESKCLEMALKDFSTTDNDEIIEYLDGHDVRKLPTEENYRQILKEVAHKELIQTPMFVVDCWTSILSGSITIDQLNSTYKNLNPTARTVCKVLKFPEMMTPEETVVSNHLKRYIRELSSGALRKFVRFCTGSDLLLADEIKVQFVGVTGFARRPVAHTCSNILEISKSFDSFPEFRSEFTSVLESNIWVMDII